MYRGEAPEVRKDRVEVMTTEQVVALEEAMPLEWKAIVVLGAGAGLRQSEALGSPGIGSTSSGASFTWTGSSSTCLASSPTLRR